MALFMKRWRSCGRSGCGRLIECWKMRPCWPLSMRRCRSGIRAAARMVAPYPGAGGAAHAIAQAHPNWSFGELEREVRANLVYRQVTRIGAEKVPDAKTLGRVARALEPQVIEKIHSRRVA